MFRIGGFACKSRCSADLAYCESIDDDVQVFGGLLIELLESKVIENEKVGSYERPPLEDMEQYWMDIIARSTHSDLRP